MREDGLRAFLAARLSPGSVHSYLANLRFVEAMLAIDLDDRRLTGEAVRDLKERLRRAGASCARARASGCARPHDASFAGARPGGDEERTAAPPVPCPRSPDDAGQPLPGPGSGLAGATVPQLMRLYADVLAELRTRGVTRTANGPVGDYAELLFARAFCLTLGGNSGAHHDATDVAGVRYQIKARRVGTGPGSRQLGALRRLPEHRFDVLAAVLFDRDMHVLRAALIPHAVVLARAKRVEHTNSWRFMLSDAVWSVAGVRDATGALTAAARAW